jgi:hypothetical protein
LRWLLWVAAGGALAPWLLPLHRGSKLCRCHGHPSHHCQLRGRLLQLLQLLLLLDLLLLDGLRLQLWSLSSTHENARGWHQPTCRPWRHPEAHWQHLLLHPVRRDEPQCCCVAGFTEPRGQHCSRAARDASPVPRCQGILEHAHACQLLLHVLCHDHELWGYLLLLLQLPLHVLQEALQVVLVLLLCQLPLVLQLLLELHHLLLLLVLLLQLVLPEGRLLLLLGQQCWWGHGQLSSITGCW